MHVLECLIYLLKKLQYGVVMSWLHVKILKFVHLPLWSHVKIENLMYFIYRSHVDLVAIFHEQGQPV
jgi:hypothetical protein